MKGLELLNLLFHSLDRVIHEQGDVLYVLFVYVTVRLVAWMLGRRSGRKKSKQSHTVVLVVRPPAPPPPVPPVIPGGTLNCRRTTAAVWWAYEETAGVNSPSACACSKLSYSIRRSRELSRIRALAQLWVIVRCVLPLATVFVAPVFHNRVTRFGVPFLIPPQVFQRRCQKILLTVMRRMPQRL